MNQQAPPGDDRGVRIGAVIVIAALTLLVAGGVFWFSVATLTGEVEAVCGPRVMSPADQCENVRTGHVESYGEVLDAQRTARDVSGWVAFVGGLGVLLVGGVMMGFAWTADPSADVEAHRSRP